MVFDPDLAPRKGDAIFDWYGDVMDVEADYDTQAPSAASARLQGFYDDMRKVFPPMNGPDADQTIESDLVTGYECHRGFIYMDFRWSQSEAANKTVPRLAKKHGLGLFDPQDDKGGVIFAGRTSEKKGRSLWRRLFG